MSRLKTAISLLKTPQKMVLPLAELGMFKWLPDKIYLLFIYKCTMDRKLRIKSPQTFNQKLQWLKLYDRNPLYSLYVDKYQVKQYIIDRFPECNVIPTIGVWNDPQLIDFETLPDQFVLKCVHGSSCSLICKDRKTFDVYVAKKRLKKWMHRNWFWFGREWPYKNVKPMIIAEPYLTDDVQSNQLKDYKFFCFNGTVRCFKIDFDREKSHKANYYSPDGTLIDVGEVVCPPDYSRTDIKPPNNLSQMIQLAQELSKDVPFLRVDFYEINNKVYFGELTFFPASGLRHFTKWETDVQFGSWLELPVDNIKG